MKRTLKIIGVLTALMLTQSACFRGGGHLFGLMATTAILTAAIVSSQPPPPPRVYVVPAPRRGYHWQPGYWTMDEGEWVWIEGRWIPEYPGYVWEPTHWENDPDGHWRLIPGRWVMVSAP